MKCLLKSARLIRYFDREFFYISNKTNCKWKQFWLGQHKYYEKVKQITTFCIEIMTPTQITRTHLWNQDMIETSMWFWSVSLANQSSGQFLIFLGSAKKIVHSQTGHFFCWPTKKRRNWPDNFWSAKETNQIHMDAPNNCTFGGLQSNLIRMTLDNIF